ncbi:MAG: glycosyltransferase family 2 protein, partial [Patescibacteria group bacterium]
MINNKKVVVVLPAYNAGKTLERTVAAIPKEFVDEIILIDDASKDNTVEVARKLGLKVFAHPKNLGYGGNQKTCYKEALKLGADVAVMVHPDFQYDPSFIPEM